ncbi:MAG: signal peptide peptidase SppA [Treponema sp.]|nr:signal peptide peptidase SppA [Treponema sp.]
MSFPLFSQQYLELNLNNQTVQRSIRSVRQKPELEVFRVIERAGGDKNIKGIVLNISGFGSTRENLWELRNALENFKSNGKKICAFISSADMDLYSLASVADKIVMDDQGLLSMFGYAFGMGYVQHSLEKLGIGVRELRYFEYKSANEMFTRDSMSEADRRQYGEYLDDIFNLTRDTLKNARSWTDEEFDSILNRGFLYSSKSALEQNLVDRVGRGEAVAEAIREIEGRAVEQFVLYGDSESNLMKTRKNYRPARAGNIFRRAPVIAIVYANGQTDMERGMAARSLGRTIRELADKKRVRAIVLRINSPGGSADAADYVAEAVRYAKQKKPVVVSMGQQAASGGYWAAMNASHITASPYTLTGSIGVISAWFYDNGLNSRLGFSVDSLQRGAHADLLTGFILPRRDLNAEEEARYRSLLLDIYGTFTAKVAAGRGMEIERVEAVAQGRVFSGQGALRAGLIDSIGGLPEAISIARNLAEIPENQGAAYNEYPKPKFWDKMLDRFPAIAALLRSGAGHRPAAASIADFFLPQPLFADIFYRLERNGRVMPILPLHFVEQYAGGN